MSVRDSFVEHFGEAQAAAIEKAALAHKNGIHDRQGSDPFKWAICICIGFECITKYRESHGITVPVVKLKRWIKKHGELGTHDGDVDFLGLFVGVYKEYVPKRRKRA